MSERDGWNHLHLYNLNGKLLSRLTRGAFPVERVEVADEETGWIYFSAHGEKDRPYDTHLYRVNLEGKGFVKLTEKIGEHVVRFSPSREYFLDTHSSLLRSPVTELQKADGTLIHTISEADVTALKDLRRTLPEEFVVKAADEKTDLYSVLFKPYDFIVFAE